jgi:hypothetical protein
MGRTVHTACDELCVWEETPSQSREAYALEVPYLL